MCEINTVYVLNSMPHVCGMPDIQHTTVCLNIISIDLPPSRTLYVRLFVEVLSKMCTLCLKLLFNCVK